MIERQTPEVWDILDEVTKGHPVLLNRAPTLHRLSIQAFEPQLIEGEAIRIHPLVCTAYNADFDGDQMAVHVPLSVEAQMEARMLMLAPNNIFSPSSGKPITTPSQDITLGCYYLTQNPRRAAGAAEQTRLPLFANAGEVEFAMADGAVKTHDRIRLKNPDLGKETIYGNSTTNVIETTAGRVLFNEIWPKELGFFNKATGKKQLIDIWTHAGDEISNVMFRTLGINDGRKELNPVYLMVDSGARGNRQQVKQLAGMRGLMAKPSGEIIERPITSNFREGLTVLEYFISTHGARKGLADTALKTADSG